MVMEILISMVLLVVGIVVLVVIHLCIVGRAFRRGFGDEVVDQSRTNINGDQRMSSEEVKKLSYFDYKGEPVDCAVCLENLQEGDTCRQLPNCNHSFHVQCIDDWLVKTPICPICRTCVVTGSRDKNGVELDDRAQRSSV